MENRPAAYMHFGAFDSYGKLDFEKKEIRKSMRLAGVLIQRLAKGLVNRKQTSKADEYPGQKSGKLRRSIKYKVSRSGFLVRISPQKISGMDAFYPAYLHYGVRKGEAIKRLAPGMGKGKKNRRAAGARAKLAEARKLEGWRVTPRGNFMEKALELGSSRVKQVLTRGFADSLK